MLLDGVLFFFLGKAWLGIGGIRLGDNCLLVARNGKKKVEASKDVGYHLDKCI